MNSESKGQYIIFLLILIFIFGLSYCSIPLPESANSKHKISKKAQTRIIPDQKEDSGSEENILTAEKSDLNKSEAVVVPSEKISVEPELKKVEEQKPEIQKDKGQALAVLDIISMDNPLYEKHTKGIVQFTHANHVEKYLIACGRCHHDETGKPLDLKPDDTAKGCIECHKETVEPKGEKLGKKEKIAKYHSEALHANCIGCHKDYNKEKGDPKGRVPAPVSCTKCHPKK